MICPGGAAPSRRRLEDHDRGAGLKRLLRPGRGNPEARRRKDGNGKNSLNDTHELDPHDKTKKGLKRKRACPFYKGCKLTRSCGLFHHPLSRDVNGAGPFFSGQPERHQLARIRAAADGDDDELLPVDHIRHRRPTLRRRQIDRANFFSCRLVERAQHGASLT